MLRRQLPATGPQRRMLSGLVQRIGYEVIPFASAVDATVAHVPREIPLTVTATGSRGLEPTLTTAIALRQSGYTVAPHLPARLVRDTVELTDITTRLEAGGIDRIFVIGGDAEEPAGQFPDALSLLWALAENGRTWADIGIAGYPEGHARIADPVLAEALVAKSSHATRVLTQICFDADAITRWAAPLPAEGVALPIHVGLPAPVSRQKLLRISAGLGLGPSARFLQKQQGMVRKFFSPAGYNPSRLLGDLVRKLPDNPAHIRGLHIFTFNDFKHAEQWRRGALEQAGGVAPDLPSALGEE